MSSVNKVMLLGHLVRDLELKTMPSSGTPVTRFTIGLNRRSTDRAGNPHVETSFIDCEAYGPMAKEMVTQFTKGRPVLVEGRLKQQAWEDKKSRERRSKVVVIVERFEYVDHAPGDQG